VVSGRVSDRGKWRRGAACVGRCIPGSLAIRAQLPKGQLLIGALGNSRGGRDIPKIKSVPFSSVGALVGWQEKTLLPGWPIHSDLRSGGQKFGEHSFPSSALCSVNGPLAGCGSNKPCSHALWNTNFVYPWTMELDRLILPEPSSTTPKWAS